jgi:hypothetical protein
LEHLIRLGTRNEVATQKELIDDLKNAAMKVNQEVLFSKIANQVGRFDNLLSYYRNVQDFFI